MKKILIALAGVAVLGLGAFASTTAFFSDTETSKANAFTAGSLDLEVGIVDDSGTLATKSDLNNRALFNFNNLIPGEMGTARILLDSNQSVWACSAAEITATKENDLTEAEADGVDDTHVWNTGELQQYIEIATWEDDGDRTYDSNDDGGLEILPLTTYASGNYFPIRDTDNGSGPIANSSQYDLGLAYCYGEFSTDANGLSCNGATAGNDSQSDSVEGTLYFYAVQSQNNPDFQCSSLNGEGDSGDDNVVYSQGFSQNNDGWSPYPHDELSSSTIALANSGDNGIQAADGGSYGVLDPGSIVTHWGGYSDTFPTNGYTTEIKVYLDMSRSDGSSDAYFDFSSAINGQDGNHEQDFIFHVGVDPDNAGQWSATVSNNSANESFQTFTPHLDSSLNPIVITQTGWYTLQSYFHDDGTGKLVVTMSILDDNGTPLKSWTANVASDNDDIATEVGGNRYGWFVTQPFTNFPIDSVRLYLGAPTN